VARWRQSSYAKLAERGGGLHAQRVCGPYIIGLGISNICVCELMLQTLPLCTLLLELVCNLLERWPIRWIAIPACGDDVHELIVD
jgi:hypothetical protein